RPWYPAGCDTPPSAPALPPVASPYTEPPTGPPAASAPTSGSSGSPSRGHPTKPAAPSSFYRRPVGAAAGLWWPRSGFVLALGVWLLLGAWGLVGVSLFVSAVARGAFLFFGRKRTRCAQTPLFAQKTKTPPTPCVT